MNKKEILKIIDILEKEYPDAKCNLNFTTNFELLVAVILSAQCTDERVNMVTPIIFKKYNTPERMMNISLSTLEDIIRPCGFFKVKSKNIKELSRILVEKYNSEVPHLIEDLISLPGVGRKTANVVLSEAFNAPVGIAVDTHVKRVSSRIGLSKEISPDKIEQDLLKLIPSKYYKQINHLLIYHGRSCCKAQNPKCEKCVLQKYCLYF